MTVPDPWTVLAAIPTLMLVRLAIPDRGRYYHEHRTIVVRKGLLLCEERAVLWHELVHADRGDTRCGGAVMDARQELSVDREAARRAMPWPVLRWGIDTATCAYDLVERMKVDEQLVRTRLKSMHPAERHYLRRRSERMEETA
jgi:hypothetical protein